MPLTDIALFKGNRFAEIVLLRPCPQRILMVTDGSLSFGATGFGLAEFVSIITGAGHSVSTAHRNGTGPVTIPGAFNFATAATPVTTANYDQIWLFGFNTVALTAPQQTVIAQFMQSGGGVFATGDHETIGAGMGNNIPRVRGMRNWATIPMVNPNRHDTVVDPGVDGIKQFDDQADAFPQQIYPVFFSNGGPDNVASSWSVHPVLRHSSGAVDFLPDHAHESECLAPFPVAGNFAGVEEWPAPVGGGARIAAQVAAISISAGRFITDTLKPPVKPRCFGAISVYDGDPARVGRIVCDATWHHFVNINLNGAGGIPDTTAAPRTGLYAGGLATPEYLKIQRYYLNTVRWLAPMNRRLCWPFVVAAITRFDFEMLEFRLPEPHPCPWDPLIRIGTVAEEALNRTWGSGMLADVVDDMLKTTGASPVLMRLLKAQQYPQGEEKSKRPEPTLLPIQDLRRAIFGSVVNLLAEKLPEDEEKLVTLLRDGHEELAVKLIVEGIRGAEISMTEYLQRSLKTTMSIVESLKPKKGRGR
ncbi:MAG TPA: hypothetical protein VFR18_23770 [Terriglobia bacterium]|nr:hypothetical protein [Terriglobia bacterium]